MTDPTQSASPTAQGGTPQNDNAIPADLPASVTVLEEAGRTVYLVGTAHISSRSVEEVATVIERVRPDTVCVELDAARHKALADQSGWREMDLVQVVRLLRLRLRLAGLS